MKSVHLSSISSTTKRVGSLHVCVAALLWAAVHLDTRAATLSETHSPSSNSVVVGDKLTFTYTLANPGTTPGVFTNRLAPNTVFVSANVTNGTYNVSNNVFYYTPDTSVAYSNIVFDVVVTPVTALLVTNRAFWVPSVGSVLFCGEVVPVTTSQPGAKMVVGRVGHQTVCLHDGRILVTGGLAVNGSYLASTDTAEVFAPNSNSFSLVGNMNAPRQLHTATLLANGMVLVAGGKPTSTSSSTALDLFDPTNNVFIPAGNMTVARASHTATLLPNGDVILAGGAATDTSIERFRLVDGQPTVSPAGNLVVARSGQLATVLSTGEILFAGGADASSAFAEKYDPATGISVATSGSGHALPAVAIAGGKVLLYGWNIQPHFAAELYDIESNSFQTLASPPQYISGRNYLTLTTGKVLITAGLYSFSVDIFDPLTASFTSAYPVNITRENHCAVELTDGRVLLVGGYDLNGTLSGDMRSTEVYAIRLDMDQDGMDDAWEVANGFDPSNRADAIEDADGDGFTNLQEYLAGTNPHDPNSNLRIQNVHQNTGGLGITFSSVAGKYYRLQTSTNLNGGVWTDVGAIISGTGSPIAVTNTIPSGAAIYRIRLVQ
jgi:Bacterial TSP3 repeat